tara:strand:- start:39 stop:269 length:231 start_codon:yes stop_codon:yes gene_type:complete
MQRFRITKIDYVGKCFNCAGVIPLGSERIRRAVKNIVTKDLNPATENKDFHVECNTEFEAWYAPERDRLSALAHMR